MIDGAYRLITPYIMPIIVVSGGIVIDARPEFDHLIGWAFSRVVEYCRSNGYGLEGPW